MRTLDVKAIPDWMILDSFRYSLGRMTYQVGITVDWLVDNWDDIESGLRQMIGKEIREEFARDDIARGAGSRVLPLGMKCDRLEWAKLLEIATVPAYFCQVCKMPPHQCLCSHED